LKKKGGGGPQETLRSEEKRGPPTQERRKRKKGGGDGDPKGDNKYKVGSREKKALGGYKSGGKKKTVKKWGGQRRVPKEGKFLSHHLRGEKSPRAVQKRGWGSKGRPKKSFWVTQGKGKSRKRREEMSWKKKGRIPWGGGKKRGGIGKKRKRDGVSRGEGEAGSGEKSSRGGKPNREKKKGRSS